jgi:hypothetical protein
MPIFHDQFNLQFLLAPNSSAHGASGYRQSIERGHHTQKHRLATIILQFSEIASRLCGANPESRCGSAKGLLKLL